MSKHDVSSSMNGFYGPIDPYLQKTAWENLICEVTTRTVLKKLNFDDTTRTIDSIARNLPEEADGMILVPTDKTVELVRYSGTRLRRVANKVFNYDNRHQYCRGVRWLRRLIIANQHMQNREVAFHFFGNPSEPKSNPKKIAKYIASHLYEWLWQREETELAMQSLEKTQSGPFRVVPYRIEENALYLCPQEVLKGLRDDEYALSVLPIECWLLMSLTVEPSDGRKGLDVMTTEDRFRIDCLGDSLRRANMDGIMEYHATCVRGSYSGLKFEMLPIDEECQIRLALGLIPKR